MKYRFVRLPALLLALAVTLHSQERPMYRDASRPVDQRVADLLGRMTIDEKVAQLQGIWNQKNRIQNADGTFNPAGAKALLGNGIGQVSRPSEIGSTATGPRLRMPRAHAEFTNAIQKDTMTLTTLRSGVGDPPKPNVIPSVAEATIDCRLLPGVNADEFVSDIRARINDPRVTVELISQPTDAGASATDTPVYAALRSAIVKNYPDVIVTPILIPYSTDSAFLRSHGVKAYGLLPMVLDAPILATFHSDEERVQVSEFLHGIRVFYDFLSSPF